LTANDGAQELKIGKRRGGAAELRRNSLKRRLSEKSLEART